MKKKFFVLFAVLLSMTLQAASPWDGTTIATSYAAGSGTLADPYQISSPTELAYLSQSVNDGNQYIGKNFILTGDLDLNGQPWTPIGNSTISFGGSFDGNSHLISNLNVNLPSTDGVGLFGYVQNATIKNVGIVGTSTVTGSGNVGGLIGKFNVWTSGFGISGCFSNATVTGGSSTWNNVGGILGCFRTTASNISSLINNCYSTGNISGTENISGTNYVAGIVGKVEANSSTGTLLTISNSYSTGTMTSAGAAYFTNGIAKNVGGAVLTVTNCYYIKGTGVTGATYKTAAQMQDAAFLTSINNSQSPAAWKADSAGDKSVNNGFPILAWSSQKIK
jgi:hypothetical protein